MRLEYPAQAYLLPLRLRVRGVGGGAGLLAGLRKGVPGNRPGKLPAVTAGPGGSAWPDPSPRWQDGACPQRTERQGHLLTYLPGGTTLRRCYRLLEHQVWGERDRDRAEQQPLGGWRTRDPRRASQPGLRRSAGRQRRRAYPRPWAPAHHL